MFSMRKTREYEDAASNDLGFVKLSAAIINCKRTSLPHLCDGFQRQLLEENFYAFSRETISWTTMLKRRGQPGEEKY